MEHFQDPLNQQRFLRRLGHRISDDDHWFWNSMVFKRTAGYRIPFFWVKLQDGGQKQVYARRFAYEMEHGKVLDSDMSVVNVCGEQMCVKPHEKHNIAVKRGSWNSKTDKRDYQLRQGIETEGFEPIATKLSGGAISVSKKHLPDIMTEEELLRGKT